MSELLTAVEFASDSYMGSTGSSPSEAVQLAIDLAEGDVSAALGYAVDDDGTPTFVSHQDTEEHPWPWPNRAMKLQRPRIITIDSVYALHDTGDCDCEWTQLDACAFIFDARRGIVHFRSCEWVSRCWASCTCPERVRVTYTTGWTAAQVAATTPLGQRLRLAISLQARHYLNLTNFWTAGSTALKSLSTMGHSQTFDFVRSAVGLKFGQSLLCQNAADILNPLMSERKGPIMIRGH
jgi:hypothetical protein